MNAAARRLGLRCDLRLLLQLIIFSPRILHSKALHIVKKGTCVFVCVYV